MLVRALIEGLSCVDIGNVDNSCHGCTCTFLPVRRCSHLSAFFAVSSIKTEPLDEFEEDHMGFGIPQILGFSSHSYYHNQRGVLYPDNSMASCQRLASSLPNHDVRFQQQSPAIVYSRGGKSVGGSPGLYQHAGGMMPDPHCSVLVHTGCPTQPVGAGQHPSIIQFSPTNHPLVRAGDPQALQQESPQIIYSDGYSPQAALTPSPTPPQAHAAAAHVQNYPTVIQQQPYLQKVQEKARSPPSMGQMEAPGDAQRRVTVKEENLDQAYLDDGECKFVLLHSAWVTVVGFCLLKSVCVIFRVIIVMIMKRAYGMSAIKKGGNPSVTFLTVVPAKEHTGAWWRSERAFVQVEMKENTDK